ncbi:aldose epimerase family protein [Primorskyibacter flagellatus]|uniref:Aldose 1-epimerase n=1 Tax=Primorskyibacter flagellatus TaxID=1387277 RepID=A0A1W2A3Y8_9RHOB|nr:aldose epimerase family protein [Primorskyibacter flagellatus]SMC55151.1 aldose 1-epimerase [Primorskyibacter flagellatus]
MATGLDIPAGQIRRHVLQSDVAQVSVLSLGCAVQDWRVSHDGGEVPVVLGYADPAGYRAGANCMGFVAGRVVNRISGASFVLNGEEWSLTSADPAYQLHGGPGGLSRCNWTTEADGTRAVRLTLHSPHLDQGYPGAVDFEITISLDGHRLTYDMQARPDRETPINLAHHSYYNLMGAGPVKDHLLRINGSNHTPNGPDLVALGHTAAVVGTVYDFRDARPVGMADLDGNIVLDGGNGPAAEVTAPNGLRLRMWTNQPCMQVYNSVTLASHGTPLPGQEHLRYTGLCLEAQGFPNAPNVPEFPSILCSPVTPYHQRTEIEIAPQRAAT